jgi:hypothetical protein
MRAPVDRRGSTFDELVDEALAELEQEQPPPLVDRTESTVLAELAELQRRAGRSQRMDAFCAGCWRFWVENSPHAGEWRRARVNDDAGEDGER